LVRITPVTSRTLSESLGDLDGVLTSHAVGDEKESQPVEALPSGARAPASSRRRSAAARPFDDHDGGHSRNASATPARAIFTTSVVVLSAYTGIDRSRPSVSSWSMRRP